jgi:hypothetical protein
MGEEIMVLISEDSSDEALETRDQFRYSEVARSDRIKVVEILGEDMVALISEDSSDEELETRGQPKKRGGRYNEDEGSRDPGGGHGALISEDSSG